MKLKLAEEEEVQLVAPDRGAICVGWALALVILAQSASGASACQPVQESAKEANRRAQAIKPVARLMSPKPRRATTENAKAAPQVELYIPSIKALVSEARRSKSGRLYEALSALVASPPEESDDAFDWAAAMKILASIRLWPDTSIEMTTYTQDRDGRPRWAFRVDWPLDGLVGQLQALIQLEETGKLVKDLTLRMNEDGFWQIELPDLILAVLKGTENGSLILSTNDLEPPENVFGRKKAEPDRKEKSLVYFRLNMEGGEASEREGSILAGLSVLSDLRYAGSVDGTGLWRERINLRWNPLMGMAIKSALKKAESPFECPKGAMASVAMNLTIAEGIADSLAGMKPGTIGTRCGSDLAISVVPGGGFLPVPDVFQQFHARNPHGILRSIRSMMVEDARRRAADDKPAFWHEDRIGEQVVFWSDPAAEQVGGISLVSYRHVVFIEDAGRGREALNQPDPVLVVALVATPAEEAVNRWLDWRQNGRAMEDLPQDENASWEAVLHWKTIYSLVEPYLSLFGSLAEKSEPLAAAESLGDALADSRLIVKIEYAGLDVRHAGPVPIGGAMVPLITALSLSETGEDGSESQRERIACQNLRTLHHHASLFRKDFGRWPANVGELDGYVDFTSHPHLLQLQPRDDGFTASLVGMFAVSSKPKIRREQGEAVIDDSLYEVDGLADDWCLRFKKDQFKEFETISIDAKGTIHRIPKKAGGPLE